MANVLTMKDTKESMITIYQDGFGIVREKRRLAAASDDNIVQYLDVAQQIETDSLLVSGLDISEFNYDYDFIDKKKILENYLDNTVFLYDKVSNTKTECTLLSTRGGIVLENKHTKKIIINPSEELILPKLPNGLITRPALIWKVKVFRSPEIGVSYITRGLTWTANYIIVMRKNVCQLTGWINVANTSGTAFENTRIKLIAEEDAKQQQIFNLDDATTLKNNQEKQIHYCSLEGIRFRKYLELDTDHGSRFKAVLELDQQSICSQGLALPQGKVKIYQEDTQDESLVLIGESIIGNLQDKQTLKLVIGEVSDLNCTVDRTGPKKQGGYETEDVIYRLKNNRREEVDLRITPARPTEGMLVSSSHVFRRLSPLGQLELWLKIKPCGEEVICLKYRMERELSAG